MCKTARSFLTTLALAAALTLPLQASAVTFEDSFENCSYPKMTDLMLVRPVGLASAALGTMLFVPMGLLGVLTVPGEVGTIWDSMVAKPWAFVVDRPLGQCNSVTVDY
jgi:hypothetical protein